MTKEMFIRQDEMKTTLKAIIIICQKRIESLELELRSHHTEPETYQFFARINELEGIIKLLEKLKDE